MGSSGFVGQFQRGGVCSITVQFIMYVAAFPHGESVSGLLISWQVNVCMCAVNSLYNTVKSSSNLISKIIRFNILLYARTVYFLYPRPGVFTAKP